MHVMRGFERSNTTLYNIYMIPKTKTMEKEWKRRKQYIAILMSSYTTTG